MLKKLEAVQPGSAELDSEDVGTQVGVTIVDKTSSLGSGTA